MSMSRNVSQALNPGIRLHQLLHEGLLAVDEVARRTPRSSTRSGTSCSTLAGGRTTGWSPTPRGAFPRPQSPRSWTAASPAPADGLWRDKEVNEAMGRWGLSSMCSRSRTRRSTTPSATRGLLPGCRNGSNEWGVSPLRELSSTRSSRTRRVAPQLLAELPEDRLEVWKDLKRRVHDSSSRDRSPSPVQQRTERTN